MPKNPPEVLILNSAKRIGLISDTHVPDRSQGLDPAIRTIYKNVDLILHAGDITIPQTIRDLEMIAPVLAVAGNNRGDRTLFDPPLPSHLVIEAAFGFRIGLVHGMSNIYHRVTDLALGRSGMRTWCTARVRRRVVRRIGDCPCVVYGHTHWPEVNLVSGILVVNPGRAFGSKRRTCGILEIRKDNISVRLFHLDDPKSNDKGPFRVQKFALPLVSEQ